MWDKACATEQGVCVCGEKTTLHDANFVVIGGTGGCRYDNLQYRQWRRS